MKETKYLMTIKKYRISTRCLSIITLICKRIIKIVIHTLLLDWFLLVRKLGKTSTQELYLTEIFIEFIGG